MIDFDDNNKPQQKSLRSYITALKSRCKRKFGQEFVDDNEELIETAARNKRLLERFDDELDDDDLLKLSTGSMMQSKEDINPLIKHRNDVAKLYADNLDALMLTPRSKYKKAEAKQKQDENDPTAEYFNSING